MAFVLPILSGRQEAWRRFYQALQGSRHCEYEESRRRLGITKELVWFTQTSLGEMALMYVETEQPERVILHLTASTSPFDHWYRQQLLELHDFDVSQLPLRLLSELIFVWQAS
jgi:hypothetical protein